MNVDAGSIQPGQWIVQPSGWYLVDAVAIRGGSAYIGTKYGVLVLPAAAPVFVGSAV